jgi:hypothetical protein
MNNVFLNCTQHALTPAQIEAAKQLGEIRNLKDVAPNIFAKLQNMDGSENLEKLAFELHRKISSVVSGETGDGTYEDGSDELREVFVHLPIGSPAFMFVFARTSGSHVNVRFLFSHTRRMIEESIGLDGEPTKKTSFIFENFITI